MDDDKTLQKRPLRSARWFRKDDLPGFVHRSTLAAAGWSREDLMTRPVVGILNTWSDLNPCNLNLRALAEDVRTGILEAGGIPFEIPMMSLSENIIKPTSFPFRNLLAMEVEETLRAHPFDAVVLLGGCDKTQPALLMGAASARIPFLFLASGPATPRSATGGQLANATGVWRLVDQLRAGQSQCDFAAFERSVMGTVGHCAEMGTASSMSALCEALGVALPGSSLVPATDRRRNQLAREAGRRSVQLAAEGGPRPEDILDARAFDNAITLLCAVGGSTNCIIHLLALAGRVGVPLTLERFDEIGRRVPLIANVQPAGEHLTERLMTAGGVPALLKVLEPLLHLDARTVDGRTIGEIIDSAEVLDPEVIRPLDKPVKPGETLVVLKGNLAPNGAVMKACAADPKLFRHRGRAVVFEDHRRPHRRSFAGHRREQRADPAQRRPGGRGHARVGHAAAATPADGPWRARHAAHFGRQDERHGLRRGRAARVTRGRGGRPAGAGARRRRHRAGCRRTPAAAVRGPRRTGTTAPGLEATRARAFAGLSAAV
jgi:dihydroxy-acid dehydratase